MLKVYLSGEIHTNWRDEIINKCKDLNLNITFYSPVTDHGLSDDVGIKILGNEEKKFWHDNKSAKINAIKTRSSIKKSDIVIVRFGEKYKQWNAAFDAGYAAALSKSLIIIQNDEHQHALKEVDAAALAVTKNTDEVVQILKYTLNGNI
ncbi:MAG: YtoQ family protein [Alphaproteobacteria bacterium]|jgi:YtoQ family protein|tara:strand:- start:666 stop:1112 length:447 start_codon:yes stop_codon:yes gene_type:complete